MKSIAIYLRLAAFAVAAVVTSWRQDLADRRRHRAGWQNNQLD